jgi:hypothetical protein
MDQDVVMNERQEIEPESDKGKKPIKDTTPHTSPIRTVREFGTASSRMEPEVSLV